MILILLFYFQQNRCFEDLILVFKSGYSVILFRDIKDGGDSYPLASFFLGGNESISQSLYISFVAVFNDDDKERIGGCRYLNIDKSVGGFHTCTGFGGILQQIGNHGAQIHIGQKRLFWEGYGSLENSFYCFREFFIIPDQRIQSKVLTENVRCRCQRGAVVLYISIQSFRIFCPDIVIYHKKVVAYVVSLPAGLFNLQLKDFGLFALRSQNSLGDIELFGKVRVFNNNKNRFHNEEIGCKCQNYPERRDIVEEFIRRGVRGGNIQGKQQVMEQIVADRNDPYLIPYGKGSRIIQGRAQDFPEETVYQRECNDSQGDRNSGGIKSIIRRQAAVKQEVDVHAQECDIFRIAFGDGDDKNTVSQAVSGCHLKDGRSENDSKQTNCEIF